MYPLLMEVLRLTIPSGGNIDGSLDVMAAALKNADGDYVSSSPPPPMTANASPPPIPDVSSGGNVSAPSPPPTKFNELLCAPPR